MVQRAEAPAERLWLVDGYNAICAGLLGGRSRQGWWGAEQRGELLSRLQALAEPGEVWVAFDGAGPTGAPPPAGRVQAFFAPCADRWLLGRVGEEAGRRPVTLATADRSLAARARRRGAQILAPAALLARCP